MGSCVGVYKTGYSTWLSSRLQNQPRSFCYVLFLSSAFSISVSRDEVSELITANNVHLMSNFKELLKDTVGKIKRANETSAELQMIEFKKIKFQEPHKFKRKANEDQYNLISSSLKLWTVPSRRWKNPSFRKSNWILRKVKSYLVNRNIFF